MNASPLTEKNKGTQPPSAPQRLSRLPLYRQGQKTAHTRRLCTVKTLTNARKKINSSVDRLRYTRKVPAVSTAVEIRIRILIQDTRMCILCRHHTFLLVSASHSKPRKRTAHSCPRSNPVALTTQVHDFPASLLIPRSLLTRHTVVSSLLAPTFFSVLQYVATSSALSGSVACFDCECA